MVQKGQGEQDAGHQQCDPISDSHKVDYEAHELPVEKLGAVEAAEFMGVPPGEVFKTIVVGREPVKGSKPVLAVVPGPSTVDLKQLAALLGVKKLHLPTKREAEQMTGLQAGGISPLARIHRGFRWSWMRRHRDIEVYISGGQRGWTSLPVRSGPTHKGAFWEDQPG